MLRISSQLRSLRTNQIVEIEIVNERIRATLSLTKIDEEYPDHKLSGAEFEVYRDVNGNKELDKEDTLLGLMEEWRQASMK